MNSNKLLQVETSDGLFMHGYYVPSVDKKAVILHVHGFEGNFYENKFVHVLANTLEQEGIGFLSVNTRGNGKDTDFNTTAGKLQKIGARYELLEEAHIDISAWVEYLVTEGYERIILQGHSLGTVKAVRYLFEGQYKDKIASLILLAPFDKKAGMVANGRTDLDNLLKKANTIVKEGRETELIANEFGDGDMSYKTFISWYSQDDLGRMFEFCSKSYTFPVLKKISVATKIIVGSKDEYFHNSNNDHPEEAMNILLSNIPNAKVKIITNAPHSFAPHEKEMAKEVVLFVKEGK